MSLRHMVQSPCPPVAFRRHKKVDATNGVCALCLVALRCCSYAAVPLVPRTSRTPTHSPTHPIRCALPQAFDPDCVSGPLPPHLAAGGVGGPGEDKPHVVSAHDVDKVGGIREGRSHLCVSTWVCVCMYMYVRLDRGLLGLCAQSTGACDCTLGVAKVGVRQRGAAAGCAPPGIGTGTGTRTKEIGSGINIRSRMRSMGTPSVIFGLRQRQAKVVRGLLGLPDGGAQALPWTLFPHGDHAYGPCGTDVVSVHDITGQGHTFTFT